MQCENADPSSLATSPGTLANLGIDHQSDGRGTDVARTKLLRVLETGRLRENMRLSISCGY